MGRVNNRSKSRIALRKVHSLRMMKVVISNLTPMFAEEPFKNVLPSNACLRSKCILKKREKQDHIPKTGNEGDGVAMLKPVEDTCKRAAVAWQLDCALEALHFQAWIVGWWISRDRQIPRAFLWHSSTSSRISIISRFVRNRRRRWPTRRGMRTSKQWQVKVQDSKNGSKNETTGKSWHTKEMRCYKGNSFWRTRYWYVLFSIFFLDYSIHRPRNAHLGILNTEKYGSRIVLFNENQQLQIFRPLERWTSLCFCAVHVY